ncbi:TRAFAC clade GTPase domain-containing protein [Kamptonema formosum]|uniref:TRAFAC clade GTPase domain-containing protein n=1 Tax=Kamptonema formosum TaxID=331992 RepID=UPI00034D9F1E|nr:hypothetical protein [Oscillatoria sp. PCC 10802]
MTSNTVKDFLETVKPGHSGITCPACGSILGIRKQGTYSTILTENARLELDGSITNYRSFLEGIEDVLEQVNIAGFTSIKANSPYKKDQTDHAAMREGGVYTGTLGAEAVEQFIRNNIDYFEWAQNFYSFMRRTEFSERLDQPLSDDSKASIQKLYNRTKEILVAGLEPRSISGPLVDLILEQKYVSQWMKKCSASRHALYDLLQEVCPNIQGYLMQLLQLDRHLNQTPDPNLEEGVLRVQFILAIVLGHKSAAHINTVADLSIQTNVPFTLPRLTLVSPKLLQKLLSSEVVLGNPNLGWDAKFVEAVRQGNANPQPNGSVFGAGLQIGNGSPDAVDKIIEILGDQITKFVHFTCTGPIGDKPGDTAGAEHTSLKCGWYPKPEKTHSVILLGSPGTGKSSVLLTGFTAFYNNVSALGATVSFDSPDDEARMKELSEKYWAGQMPKPTQHGARTSIKLSIEFPAEPYRPTNFVFTDIPGEVAASSLTEYGSNPAVLRTLKKAETIIFFFDLSVEPCVREKLTKGDDSNVWKVLEDNYKRVNDSRKQVAGVSQLQLLQKLVRDLKLQKGADTLQGTKFICVIPKSDLFANSEEPEMFFLTEFYKSLQQRQILVSSRQHRSESFAGLYSLGGAGSQIANSRGVELQKQIGQLISQEALSCLAKIGNALGDEPELAPLKKSLSETIAVRLVAMLKQAFGEEDAVYFLPVSAQGEDSKSIELGHPPNQKLSEYVFILPIALSAEKVAQPAATQQQPASRFR